MSSQEINVYNINIFAQSELKWNTGGDEFVKQLARKNGKAKTAFIQASKAFAARDFVKAKELFERLHQDYPKERGFLVGLILSCIACNENVDKLLKEESVQNSGAIFYYLDGLISEIANDYREAIRKYRMAVQKDDHCTPAMFRLAYYLDIRGEDEQAVKLYERCMECSPCHTNALVNLGIMYEDNNLYYRAMDCYRKVLKRYPHHPRALLYLKDAQASISMYVDEEKEREQDKQNQILATPISDFELSVRSKNCLNKMKIKTLGDLIKKTEAELLSYKNFGETSLAEIKDILSKKGLRLGMGREEEVPTKKKERKSAKPNRTSGNQEIMSLPISNLELSVRSRKCLSALSVKTIGDLADKSEKDLLGCKNFGHTSMLEIKQKLADMGINLREN